LIQRPHSHDLYVFQAQQSVGYCTSFSNLQGDSARRIYWPSLDLVVCRRKALPGPDLLSPGGHIALSSRSQRLQDQNTPFLNGQTEEKSKDEFQLFMKDNLNATGGTDPLPMLST
jgi:hypothetical protein